MLAGKILTTMSKIGVGIDYGVVNIISLQSCTPRIIDFERHRSKANLTEEKKGGVRAELAHRLPIEEIYEMIMSQNHLNFDYVAMCFVAAVIAAIGLLTDNIIVLVASMLLSPLMGPILGVTFGTIVQDKRLLQKGVRNEMVGLLVTFIVGIIVALCTLGADLDKFPTEEMELRGNGEGLVAGLAIAIPSGAGVALAVTAGTINPLVGVAIAASVLPPVVNSGICLVLGIARLDNDRDQANKLLRVSGVSMVLWFINVVAIYVVALIVFKMKSISKTTEKSNEWKELHEDNVGITPAGHMRNSSLQHHPKLGSSSDTDLGSSGKIHKSASYV